MNICLVSKEYPPETHLGGIGTYTAKAARGLVNFGHSVQVISQSDTASSITTQDGVTIHRLRKSELHPRTLTRSIQVSQAIARLKERPAIVQACEWGGEAWCYALQKKAPLITRLATPAFLVAEQSPNIAYNKRTLAALFLEQQQTQWSDTIISPTWALADIVCKRWGIDSRRVTIVPTGVDFTSNNRAQAAPLPAQLVNRPFVLYFGRLEERKGVHVLAEALVPVLTRHPDLSAVFVGESKMYRGKPMQEHIAAVLGAFGDRVLVFPRQDHSHLFPIVQAATIVALPSLWENLANTCLEAMELGKPVIATTGCGFSEVIEDGESGLLVPPGDPEKLGQVLEVLISRPELGHRLGQQARLRAQAFTVAATTARLVQVYEQVLSTHQQYIKRGKREESRVISA